MSIDNDGLPSGWVLVIGGLVLGVVSGGTAIAVCRLLTWLVQR